MKAAHKLSEISEEVDEESYMSIDPEAQKDRIRQIISYQKSLYHSSSLSSSSDSSSASSRSFASSSQSSSLLDLMKVGGMSLCRLFDMEHTSLATHLKDYSGSPVTRPIFLWGSDSDGSLGLTSWSPVKSFRISGEGCRSNSPSVRTLEKSFTEGRSGSSVKPPPGSWQRLTRKRSYKALPGYRMWRWKGFGLRLRRLKIVVCGKIFY